MGYFKSYSLNLTEDSKPSSTLDAYIKIITSFALSTLIGQAIKIFVEDKVTEDFVIKLEAYKSNKKFYNYLLQKYLRFIKRIQLIKE